MVNPHMCGHRSGVLDEMLDHHRRGIIYRLLNNLARDALAVFIKRNIERRVDMLGDCLFEQAGDRLADVFLKRRRFNIAIEAISGLARGFEIVDRLGDDLAQFFLRYPVRPPPITTEAN